MIDRRGFLALATTVAASTLAACSTGSTSTHDAAPASGRGSAGFPVTVKHAFGTTTITNAPAKIVTTGWSDADIVAALGIVPVAAPAITWAGNANKSTDWFDAKLKELGGTQPKRFSDTDGIPVDTIATYQPDLILGTNSGMTKAEYDKLSKIAPVVAYPKLPYGTSWQDSTTLVAAALGRKAEGAKLIAATEKKIADAVAKHSDLKGKSAAWVYFTPSNLNTIGIYTTNDNRPRMLLDFGTTTPAFVTSASKGTDTFFVDLSAEKAASIDADILVFDGTAVQTPKITGNALLGRIPAFTSGAYAAIMDQQATAAMSSPTPLSIPVAIEKFLPQLAKAAAKA